MEFFLSLFRGQKLDQPNQYGVLMSDMLVPEEKIQLDDESRWKKFFIRATRLENLLFLIASVVFIVSVIKLVTTHGVITVVAMLTLYPTAILSGVALVAIIEHWPEANMISRFYHKAMSLLEKE